MCTFFYPAAHTQTAPVSFSCLNKPFSPSCEPLLSLESPTFLLQLLSATTTKPSQLAFLLLHLSLLKEHHIQWTSRCTTQRTSITHGQRATLLILQVQSMLGDQDKRVVSQNACKLFFGASSAHKSSFT